MIRSFLPVIVLLTPVLLAGCTSNTVQPGSTCAGLCVNGQGTLTYGGQSETGHFVMGLRTGNFEIRAKDRTMRVPMVNGVAHGTADILRDNGDRYSQRFAYGLAVEGTSLRDNGDRYEGTFQTVSMLVAPATASALPTPATVTVFRKGTYHTAKGRYEGQFALAGEQLVFEGVYHAASRKAQPLTAAAPYTVNTTDGYAFVPVTRAQIAGWISAQEKLALDYKTKQYTVAAQPAVAQAALTQALVATPTQASGTAAPVSFNMIEGNGGRYMSPITSDGVAAAWVDKSINASLGSSIGGMAGAYAGQKALEQVPFVGGFLGQKAGAATGRSIALKAVGGEAYLRETSDISFNNINDMAGWLVQNHRSHAKFAEIMKAAGQIYPELTPAYVAALRRVR